MDLQQTLLEGLKKASQAHTSETLGDRSEYLGASEIGYCPRKVVLEKFNPSEHDLATLLRFERGHMSEEIIKKAFSFSGYTNFEEQVEVVLPGTPVKVHIDLVFTSKTLKIKSILEIKSSSIIPNEPYGSWESQLYIQMGALAKQYPYYNVKGAIVVMDLAGEVEWFNGYEPQGMIFNGLMKRAEMIWSDYQTMLRGNDLVREGLAQKMKTENGPLCGFCKHITTCPRFETEEVPELAEVVDRTQKLNKESKRLDREVKDLKKHLFPVVKGKDTAIKAGSYILKEATRSKKYIDFGRLEAYLAQSGSSLEEFQGNRPYSFLEIKPIKA